jgi:hypothetical protein
VRCPKTLASRFVQQIHPATFSTKTKDPPPPKKKRERTYPHPSTPSPISIRGARRKRNQDFKLLPQIALNPLILFAVHCACKAAHISFPRGQSLTSSLAPNLTRSSLNLLPPDSFLQIYYSNRQPVQNSSQSIICSPTFPSEAQGKSGIKSAADEKL